MNSRILLAALAPFASLALATTGYAQLGAIEPPGAGIIKRPTAVAPAGEVKPGETKPGEAKAGEAKPGAPKQAKGPTEIISREATLNNRINLAVFIGEVDVKDPEFHMTCDKLTVFLKKPKTAKDENAAPGEPAPIGAEATPAPKKSKDDPKAGATGAGAKAGDKAGAAADKGDKGDDDSGGKIDRAIADGNVIIDLVQIDGDGQKKIYHGKAKHAVFDTKKNTCVLTGWPQIAEGSETGAGKELIAREENAVITLDRAGEINGTNTLTRIHGEGSLFDNKKKPAPAAPAPAPAR
jgi:lipopolysaccharide export system protein LptA